jgi:hypothetical protein
MDSRSSCLQWHLQGCWLIIEDPSTNNINFQTFTLQGINYIHYMSARGRHRAGTGRERTTWSAAGGQAGVL